MCLLGIAGRAGEITCCRLDAGARKVSVNSLRKPFVNVLENLHCFSVLLLKLQASTIGIELRCSRNFNSVVPGGFRLIRAVQSFENIRFGAEIIEPFLILN